MVERRPPTGRPRKGPPRVTVLYHYFHPDDVVSARHFADFCLDLRGHGWAVEAWPCNRACRDESQSYPLREEWQDIAVRRVWRPGFRQASGVGRILNAAWMLAAWSLRACKRGAEAPDVLVVGTDPVLSVLAAAFVRKFRPNLRIAHWCFDLYPEGPIADGLLRPDGWPVQLLGRLLRSAYAACDLVADLGSCMRSRLEVYGHQARKVTLVPWALAEPSEAEPPDPLVRRELFGEGSLGLLYSGNFGRAHSCTEFLDLARRLRGTGVHFSFGVRGNRAAELRGAVRPDDGNVTLAGFAPESELSKRLAAADIHLVSLRPDWTGLVVPSKFFGSLAAGRPVLFAGSRQTSIARSIQDHQVGWVLDQHSQAAIAAELQSLAAAPHRLVDLQRHCHRVYQQHFSRQRVMNEWNRELRGLLPGEARGTPVRQKP